MIANNYNSTTQHMAEDVSSALCLEVPMLTALLARARAHTSLERELFLFMQ